MARLYQKLSYIMEQNKITDGLVAAAVHCDRSTVNKWRHDKLVCKRDLYGRNLSRCLFGAVEQGWLRALLGARDDAGGDLAGLLEDYLYDDAQDIRTPALSAKGLRVLKDRTPAAGGCFLDVEGLLNALYLFAERLGEAAPRPIAVYLSSDNCRVLLDDKMAPVWDDLYLLNRKRPVRMILEGCRDDERFREIVRHFMGGMQAGRLELCAIASADRYFCYHISFLCEDTCMVMATEPAAFGPCVSFYVESPEFVRPMSRTMAKLGGLAKPIARAVRDAKAETTRLGELMERDGALQALFGGANLLYAPVEAFRELLRRGGLSYAQRKYPLERFRAQKERFEAFLATAQYREIVSLAAIDDIIQTNRMTVPDLSVPLGGRVAVDPAFLGELLEGMIDYSRRYPGLRFLLVREMSAPTRNITCRIREEQSLLLGTCFGEAKYAVRSEHWLFVGEYNRLLEEVSRGADVIRAPARVRTVLGGRAKELRRGQGAI